MEMFKTKIIKTSMDGPFENHVWKWDLMLPKYLADWDVWDYWEKEMLFNMEANLKKGDILFDVGSEAGYFGALFGKYMVGGENVIMFEPSCEYWDLIENIWIANNLQKPLAKWVGFVSDTSNKIKQKDKKDFTEKGPYKNMKNKKDFNSIARTTIDDFVKNTKLIPKGIKIDIEGAEFLAVTGAIKTMSDHKPMFWISIHPDLMLNYGHKPDDIFNLFKDMGYSTEYLSTDHEMHYRFY